MVTLTEEERKAFEELAELLRAAGVLANHSQKLLARIQNPELELEVAEITEAVDHAEELLTACWGAVLPKAGPEYLAKVQQVMDAFTSQPVEAGN